MHPRRKMVFRAPMTLGAAIQRGLVWLIFCQLSLAQILPSTASLTLKGSYQIQNFANGYLENFSGTHYDLSRLSPYNSLVPDQDSNDASTMPIYRAVYDDGTMLLVEKDLRGQIIYAKLQGETNQSTLYFAKTQECNENELIVFSESQVEDTDFDGLSFGDEELPDDSLLLPSYSIGNEVMPLAEHVYTAGDGTSSECVYFKVVKVGIVYDAEFCHKYGGKTESRNRILLIVAAASLLFENDMCVRLQLVDIYTPDDDDCAGTSAFASMPRDVACKSGAQSESFIRYFADWTNAKRELLGFDPDAIYHAFTGYPPRGTLGCGYIGTACRNQKYAYGVNYMSSNFLSSQSIIFTHELAHNLAARHLSDDEAGGKRYIMKPSLQNPNDGFSELSIQRILGFLDSDDVTCDGVEYPPETTENPTPFPSPAPSPRPPSRSLPSHACELEQADEDKNCFLASNTGLFGCIEMQDLMRVKPNIFCANQNPTISRVAFESCQEEGAVGAISNDQDRHLRIKKVGNNNDPPSDQQDWANEDPLKTSPPIMEISYHAAGSNDWGLDSFVADDCSRSECITFENYVCFPTDLLSGQDDRTFVVTFSGTVSGDPGELFAVEVVVRRKDDDSLTSWACQSPETKCLDR